MARTSSLSNSNETLTIIEALMHMSWSHRASSNSCEKIEDIEGTTGFWVNGMRFGEKLERKDRRRRLKREKLERQRRRKKRGTVKTNEQVGRYLGT